MKRVKFTKVIYWLLGLLATGVAGLSLVVSFLDWNQYRTTLEDLASSQLGMQVDLAGDVSLVLLPRPAITVGGVRLSPETGGEGGVVATAERIGVYLGFSNFLQGKISFQSVTLDGLDVTVEGTEDGSWRIRGWPETQGASNPEIELVRFSLNGGRVAIVPYGGKLVALEGISLNLQGNLPNGPLDWDGDFSILGQEVMSSGRVRPVRARDELSVKANFGIADSTLSMTGRLFAGGDLTGRVEYESQAIGAFIKAVSVVSGTASVSAPYVPAKLDLQIDKQGEITRLVSRAFNVADTLGRLDLTLAQTGGKNHLTGSVSMGVIALDDWIAAMPDVAGEDIQTIVADDTNPQNFMQGAIDLTIEGVRMQSGLGRRVDAVVALKPEGAVLTSLKALLPGATNVAFTGKLTATKGQGKLHVGVGNLSGLASWVGFKLPGNIPAGRLATAKLKADLALSSNGWSLFGIDGVLDTTPFTGELGGEVGTLVPQQIRLVADTVNLDAYFPLSSDVGVAGDFDLENTFIIDRGMAIDVDISMNHLHWMGEQFSKVRVAGAVADGGLTISHMLAMHKYNNYLGKIDLFGTITGPDKAKEVDLTVKVADWSLPIVRYFVPSLSQHIQAAHMNVVDGAVSLVGPLGDLKVGLDVNNAEKILSLTGTVGVVKNKLASLDLQGRFAHSDLAELVQSVDVLDVKALPARGLLNITRSGAQVPFKVRVSGDVAGGKLTSYFTYAEALQKLEFSYNHDKVEVFSDITGFDLPGLDQTASLRSEGSFEAIKPGDGWRVSLDTVKNGHVSANGQIYVSAEKQLDGVLAVTGFDFRSLQDEHIPQQGGTGVAPFSEYLKPLADYGGKIELSITNGAVSAQRVDAPNASLLLGDSIVQLSLGAGATMNAQPIEANVTVTLEEKFPYEGVIRASAFNVGNMLKAKGLGQVITAETAIDVAFSGRANTANLMENLKASGTTTGQAGVLNFLSVPNLIGQIHAAKTGRAFLGKVGEMLRSGTTSVDKIRSQFSFDGGVMLLETAEASGAWGNLALNGQVNFLDEFLTLKGALSILDPTDTPEIPVEYKGSFGGPTAQWSSRLFERFVISAIERRLRSSLFKELETRKEAAGQAGNNPGVAVFSRAFGFLGQLKKAQEAKQNADKAQKQQGQTQARDEIKADAP